MHQSHFIFSMEDLDLRDLHEVFDGLGPTRVCRTAEQVLNHVLVGGLVLLKKISLDAVVCNCSALAAAGHAYGLNYGGVEWDKVLYQCLQDETDSIRTGAVYTMLHHEQKDSLTVEQTSILQQRLEQRILLGVSRTRFLELNKDTSQRLGSVVQDCVEKCGLARAALACFVCAYFGPVFVLDTLEDVGVVEVTIGRLMEAMATSNVEQLYRAFCVCFQEPFRDDCLGLVISMWSTACITILDTIRAATDGLPDTDGPNVVRFVLSSLSYVFAPYGCVLFVSSKGLEPAMRPVAI